MRYFEIVEQKGDRLRQFVDMFGEKAATEHLAKLDRIVAVLKANPLAPYMRVFGSATTGEMFPSDIDCLVENGGKAGAELYREGQSKLIRLARDFYGCLDPFLLGKRSRIGGDGRKIFDEVLFCRTDDARGWQVAENPKALIAAGRSGIPVLEFDRVFAHGEEPTFDNIQNS